jgi:hypothetical protein
MRALPLVNYLEGKEMPLVNTKAPTANPQVITATQAVRYSRAALNSLYGRLRSTQRELYRRAYQGSDYTVDEYFAALGEDGAEMLSVMKGIVVLLEQIKPGTVPTSQQTPPISQPVAQNVDMRG